ncbi:MULTISPECIES: Lrp/AsnC family transcriptional regulator [Litoreibacter]|uniref:Transcriptional regulator, AsnC family n=1 Tax=Litoreibacter arenae DSM 19593 TaxID=1123360 RepID=S9QF98_9RHOB|nr:MULTISPECIES: Lrp/AsnC family transcriptional regulator [Litoreibacter]EPX80081.1 Transcriptional regulator, AsnC family [Litoreibacter arenae DSM 19593]
MLDDADRRLLRYLQSDPTAPVSELAERCAMQPATAARRLEKLSAKGILKGQHAVIDWTKLGFAVEVSLRFTLDKTAPRAFDEFQDAARKIPEVIAIQTFLGRVDLRLSVIARDMTHYQSLYRNQILTLPHIAELEPLMHVATIKTTETLPI